jgi:hypothetical protein
MKTLEQLGGFVQHQLILLSPSSPLPLYSELLLSLISDFLDYVRNYE